MIVNIKGRNIEFDDRINELHKTVYGYGLSDGVVLMHILSVYENDVNIINSLSNEEIVDLVSNCVKEDYSLFL